VRLRFLLALIAGALAATPVWALTPRQKLLLLLPHAPPSLDLNFISGVLDPRITFTRAAGPATYFDVAGTLQTAGTNVPRFDYDPVTHAAKGLLIEESRINLYLNSATLGTQGVTTANIPYTVSFYGTGTITFTGTCSGATSLVGAGAFPARASKTFTPTAGTCTSTISGSVLDANFEAGAFATSYITTTWATGTRAADVATMPIGQWFNLASGTYFGEFALNAATGRVVQLGDGNNADILFLQPANVASGNTFSATVNQGRINTGAAFVAGVVNKTAYAVNNKIRALIANGGTIVASTTAARPVGPTTFYIGIDNSSTSQANGYLRRIRYWSRVLSNAELQQVTR
jgi:hypothetical protein